MASPVGAVTQCNRKVDSKHSVSYQTIESPTLFNHIRNITLSPVINLDFASPLKCNPIYSSQNLTATNIQITPACTKPRLVCEDLHWDNSYDFNRSKCPEESAISNTTHDNVDTFDDIFKTSIDSMPTSHHENHIIADKSYLHKPKIESTKYYMNTDPSLSNPNYPKPSDSKPYNFHSHETRNSSIRIRSKSQPQAYRSSEVCLSVTKVESPYLLELPLSPSKLNLDYFYLTKNTLTPSPQSNNYSHRNQVISSTKSNLSIDYIKQLNRVYQ